jgi:hypothetical protein
VCCNTAWQMWYLWLVVAIVILITAFLAWKYQTIDCSEQDELSISPAPSTLAKEVKNSQYDYKLLVNDIDNRYFETQLNTSNNFTLKILN